MSDSLFENSALRDPSWKRAQDIATRQMQVPSSVCQLIRGSWTGEHPPKSLLKILGMAHINPRCLVAAADLPNDKDVSFEDVEQAIFTLGSRVSAVVVATSVYSRTLLGRKKLPPAWRGVFRSLISSVEIGYRAGLRSISITAERGMLVGLAYHAGTAALFCESPDAYREATLGKNKTSSDPWTPLFGCRPAQVSAYLVQQFGFGLRPAVGIALADLAEIPPTLSVSDEELDWRAATLWVRALIEARNYPSQIDVRERFSDIRPPTDSNQRNLLLETLHTEVSSLVSKGSQWTWHLPTPSYDETEKLLA